METFKVVDKKTQNFTRNIETLENNVQCVVSDFLKNPTSNCLYIKTLMTGETNLLVYQILRNLNKDELIKCNSKRTRNGLNKFLGVENQTFLDWPQLFERNNATLPMFRNLFICEISTGTSLAGSEKIFEELIYRLENRPFLKLILISSKNDILEQFSLMASSIKNP